MKRGRAGESGVVFRRPFGVSHRIENCSRASAGLAVVRASPASCLGFALMLIRRVTGALEVRGSAARPSQSADSPKEMPCKHAQSSRGTPTVDLYERRTQPVKHRPKRASPSLHRHDNRPTTSQSTHNSGTFCNKWSLGRIMGVGKPRSRVARGCDRGF